MTGTHRHLTGRIQVNLPPHEAFRLFTPRGEQDWVSGWQPRFAAPAADDTEPGTVFETDAHGQRTIWLVLDRQWGKRISYARITPDDNAGIVTIVINSASGHSGVQVTYELTAHIPPILARCHHSLAAAATCPATISTTDCPCGDVSRRSGRITESGRR
jgi:hypothetical protein